MIMSGTLSKGWLFCPKIYWFSLVRDSFMCMNPWLLLQMLLKFDLSSIPKAGHILLEAAHRLVAIWILGVADLTFHNLNQFHFPMVHMACHISVKVFQAVLWIPFCGFLPSFFELHRVPCSHHSRLWFLLLPGSLDPVWHQKGLHSLQQ